MKISKYNAEGYYDPTPHAALSSIEKRRQKPLVYIASPFSGNESQSIANAIRYCRFAVNAGAIPLAPHLFLSRFMSEAAERTEVMSMNMIYLRHCEELWVFGSRVTEGMAAEIAKAEKHHMPIRYFIEVGDKITEVTT